MEPDILNFILSSTFTTHKLQRRMNLLKNYINAKVYNSAPLDFKKMSIDAEDIEWIQSFDEKLLGQITTFNFGTVFQNLDAEIKKITPLILYIPVELPSYEIIRLGNYLRQSYGPKFLVDIKIDPTLIAGCALVWNGKYYDYSLRQKISQNKDIIVSKLKEFANR